MIRSGRPSHKLSILKNTLLRTLERRYSVPYRPEEGRLMANVVSKIKYAAMLDCNRSIVTRNSKPGGPLAAAVVGQRIDADHPSAKAFAKEYKNERDKEGTIEVDALYIDAVEFLRQLDRAPSGTALKKHFKIGAARAQNLCKAILASGILDTPPDAPPEVRLTRPVDTGKRGQASVDMDRDMRGGASAAESKKRGAKETPVEEYPEHLQNFLDYSLRDICDRFGTDVRFVDFLKATAQIETITERRLKNAASEGKLVSRDLVESRIVQPLDGIHVRMLTDGVKTIARRVTALHDSGRTMVEIEKEIASQLTNFIKPVKIKVDRVLKNA